MFEKYFQALYMDQLSEIRAEQITAIRHCGPGTILEIRRALANWRTGTAVKSVAECVAEE